MTTKVVRGTAWLLLLCLILQLATVEGRGRNGNVRGVLKGSMVVNGNDARLLMGSKSSSSSASSKSQADKGEKGMKTTAKKSVDSSKSKGKGLKKIGKINKKMKDTKNMMMMSLKLSTDSADEYEEYDEDVSEDENDEDVEDVSEDEYAGPAEDSVDAPMVPDEVAEASPGKEEDASPDEEEDASPDEVEEASPDEELPTEAPEGPTEEPEVEEASPGEVEEASPDEVEEASPDEELPTEAPEGPTEEPEGPTEEPAGGLTSSIVDLAVATPDLSTLVELVTAAGLVDTLATGGPFTVFAPTNDAFAALPEDVVSALLADPEGALTYVLLYHAVEGTVLAEDLSDGMMVTTLNGETVEVSIGDTVMINNSTVVLPDILASNGVVHIIDAVLIPPMLEQTMAPTIAETAAIVETDAPTVAETAAPTMSPTVAETPSPTMSPTALETAEPTVMETVAVTAEPTQDLPVVEAVTSSPTVGEVIVIETMEPTGTAEETAMPTAGETTVSTTVDTSAPTSAPVAATSTPTVMATASAMTPSPTSGATAAATGEDATVTTASPTVGETTPSPTAVVTTAPEPVTDAPVTDGSGTAAPTACPGRGIQVIATLLMELDPEADLTEPTEEQVVEVAQHILQAFGVILREMYGAGIRGFSATIDETDTALDGNAYPLGFDANILFAPCAPPPETVNAIFADADYEAILSTFEPTGADNVFQFLTGEATYTGEAVIEF